MACIFLILKHNKYAKITSKPYCVYIVTLSLYYQVKKYSFWPAAAPAHTASRYIRSRRLDFVAGHSDYPNFTKYKWPFVNYYDNEKKISTRQRRD